MEGNGEFHDEVHIHRIISGGCLKEIELLPDALELLAGQPVAEPGKRAETLARLGDNIRHELCSPKLARQDQCRQFPLRFQKHKVGQLTFLHGKCEHGFFRHSVLLQERPSDLMHIGKRLVHCSRISVKPDSPRSPQVWYSNIAFMRSTPNPDTGKVPARRTLNHETVTLRQVVKKPPCSLVG